MRGPRARLHSVVDRRPGEPSPRPAQGLRSGRKTGRSSTRAYRGRGAFVEVSLPWPGLHPGRDPDRGRRLRWSPWALSFGLRVALVGNGVEQVKRAQRCIRELPERVLSRCRQASPRNGGGAFPHLAFAGRSRAVLQPPRGRPGVRAGGDRSSTWRAGVVRHRVPVIVGLFEPRTGRDGKAAPGRRGSLARGLGARREAGGALAERGCGSAACAGCTVEVASAVKGLRAGLGARCGSRSPGGCASTSSGGACWSSMGWRRGEEGFDRRFRLVGREEAQVLAALGPALRRALRAFHRADVDDREAGCGAQRRRRTSRRSTRSCRRSTRSRRRSRRPARRCRRRRRWRRAARVARLRGGERRGAPDRFDAALGDARRARFELETLFKGAVPARTRVSLRLDPPIEGAARPRNAAEQGIAAAILEQAARVGGVAEAEEGVAVAPGAIAVVIGAPLADPAAAREVLRPMLALARQMRGEGRGGRTGEGERGRGTSMAGGWSAGQAGMSDMARGLVGGAGGPIASWPGGWSAGRAGRSRVGPGSASERARSLETARRMPFTTSVQASSRSCQRVTGLAVLWERLEPGKGCAVPVGRPEEDRDDAGLAGCHGVRGALQLACRCGRRA